MKLRTLEEENAIREAASVGLYTFKIEPKWIKTGIESPFGGEILEEIAQPLPNSRNYVKCSKTGKTGTMQTDGSVGAIIKGIIWED